jgi:DNA-directed RNA polymerase specialized sigma24 family protein
MSGKPPHPSLRRIYILLGIVIAGGLMYQNFTLYSITKNLRRAQLKTPRTELHPIYESDEVSEALASLAAENAIYKASLKRQRINLRECLSKLPQHEKDDFYQRHRDELELELNR